MLKKTEKNIQESYDHIKPYLKDMECTKELREMCDTCEAYNGEEHSYEECRKQMCFKMFLAFKYLEWCNSF